MLKKVVIAGLAVAVGVAVLAWISPPLFDWMCHQAKAVQKGIDDSIPPQQRIEILKDKLKALEQNKSKYFDAVAHEDNAVKDLSKEVDGMTDRLAAQWARIDAFNKDLDTQKTSFTYGGKDYKRSDVEAELKRDWDAYKVAEKALDAKKDLLNARKQALDTAKSQLASLETRRDEMAAQITKMEADLKVVQMQEQVTATKFDDNEYAKLEAEINEVSGKIADRQHSLELQAQFSHGGEIDPLADKTAPAGKDFRKEIDDYKAAKDGPAKANIAEQK
jgi:chromosome segregation ATPase